MFHPIFRLPLLALVALALASPAAAQGRQEAIVLKASAVLDEIMAVPVSSIPQSLLADAEAIAIVPSVVKGGFVIGVRHGKGVVLIRDEGGWQAPQFISLTGGSVGFQVGVQSTDVILVFKSRRSVEGLLSGKFTIGADAAAAAGPVGRQAAAATDERLAAEIYSYSRSRGLFAGVSLDGSVLEVDPAAATVYYRPTDLSPAPDGRIAIPQSAAQLMQQVARYSTVTAAPQPAAGPATSVLRPPAGTGDPQSLRQQLSQASLRLFQIVDPTWQRYLALPQEIYSPQSDADPAALRQVLASYDAVATTAAYRALSSREEFRRTHELLRLYTASRTPARTLALPPPPR